LAAQLLMAGAIVGAILIAIAFVLNVFFGV
jgi:hypothetical protein